MKRRLGVGVLLLWAASWTAVSAQTETNVAAPANEVLSPEDAARILAQSPGLSNRTPPTQEPQDATSATVTTSPTSGPSGEFKTSPTRPLTTGYPVARLPRRRAAPRRSTKTVKSTPPDLPNDTSQR
jgi:hypothetical protein